MCHGCVEFLCQYSYKTARGMEHSGWTLTPLCLLWCLPLRLRPLRSQTALQRLCLTPANCLTLSDERLTFYTVHQRSGPLVGPEVGAESKEVHHSLRLCSAHNFLFFYLFKKKKKLVAAVYHRRVVLVMAVSL